MSVMRGQDKDATQLVGFMIPTGEPAFCPHLLLQGPAR